MLLVLISAVSEIGAHLEPVDETQVDSSFTSFKKDLNTAIEKKDSAFLAKILSDEVEYSFGADPDRKNAVDGFLKHYKIKNGKASDFWKNLEDVLKLGCTKSAEAFVCPYVYSKWPDKFDSFSFIATIHDKTPVRKKPEPKAKVLKLVTFEILKLATTQQTEDWYTIDLGGKKIGFVAKSDARSPAGYRAEFQKTSDSWKMKNFIAGD